MMNKLYFLILILTLTSCHSNTSNRQNKIEITDMLGRKVLVTTQVSRIIGLKAGTLRLISYLDASERVIGVEDIEKKNHNPYNLAFPKYDSIPTIGPIHGGDPELITAANPDVIFISHATVGDANQLQKQTGIPVIAIQYGDLCKNTEHLYQSLKLIAKVLHRAQRADSLISGIEELISDLNQRSNNQSNEKVYIGGLSYKGTHGITSTDPCYAPFQMINAHNVSSEIDAYSNVFIDKEQLIEWNPDKLFIDCTGRNIVEQDLENEALTSLKALSNQETYLLLPHNWYAANFETIFINAYYVGSVLYPDDFSDIQLNKKADEIFRLFLGVEVYDKFVEYLGHPGKMNFSND